MTDDTTSEAIASALDVGRDALAAILCVTAHDEAGLAAVLDHCDLRAVAGLLAATAADALEWVSPGVTPEQRADEIRRRMRELSG